MNRRVECCICGGVGGGGGAGHVLFKKAPHTSVCLHNDCSSVGIAPDYVIVAAY